MTLTFYGKKVAVILDLMLRQKKRSFLRKGFEIKEEFLPSWKQKQTVFQKWIIEKNCDCARSKECHSCDKVRQRYTKNVKKSAAENSRKFLCLSLVLIALVHNRTIDNCVLSQ